MSHSPSNSWAFYQQVVFCGLPSGTVFPEAFAIITACNPDGQDQPASVNRLADERLEARLRDLGHAPMRITGCSPDFVHQEPGWLVDLSEQVALELGHAFGQEALFRVEADRLMLIPCRSTEPLVDLGAFSARLRESPLT
ncbi:MAG: hypothetical protein ACI9QL_002328 [Candidatus Omnitrophota bacterium]|jgi:hypothetical protein